MTESMPGAGVEFRPRFWWAALLVLAVTVPTLAVVWTALGLVVGAGPWPAPGRPLLVALAAAAVGAVAGTALRGRRPARVRLSDAGIELVRGGVPVLVAWTNVATASVRGRGVFAVLDVVPADLGQVVTDPLVRRARWPHEQRLRNRTLRRGLRPRPGLGGDRLEVDAGPRRRCRAGQGGGRGRFRTYDPSLVRRRRQGSWCPGRSVTSTSPGRVRLTSATPG